MLTVEYTHGYSPTETLNVYQIRVDHLDDGTPYFILTSDKGTEYCITYFSGPNPLGVCTAFCPENF